MNGNKRAAFVRRWNDIQDRKEKVLQEECDLLAEIRNEFPNGASGDLQFTEFCVNELGAPRMGHAKRALLERAKAPRELGELMDFVKDARAAATLMHFTRSQRKKITKAFLGRNPDGLMTSATILQQGYRMGFRSSRNTERKLDVRRERDEAVAHLLRLYEEYEDLPEPPPCVLKLLSGGSKTAAALMAKG